METITYLKNNWRITDIKSAQDVLETFPDKRVGNVMINNNLELLLIEEIGRQAVDLGILRMTMPPRKTAVFRNKSTQEILDIDDFLDSPEEITE